MHLLKTHTGHGASRQCKWRSFFIAKNTKIRVNKPEYHEPKKFEPILSSKAYWVDTSSRMIFYIPILRLWEKFAAGLENQQVLRTFLTAVVINLFAGRLHGKVREWVRKAMKVTDESPEKLKKRADRLSGFIVGLSTYLVVIASAGPKIFQSIVAIAFAIPFTLLTGDWFGKFQDYWRKKWGTTPVFEKKEKE